MMGMGFGFGLVLMILFWIFIVGLAVWLLSSLFPRATDISRTNKGNLTNSPFEILRERYARSEISKEEYDEMIIVLKTELR